VDAGISSARLPPQPVIFRWPVDPGHATAPLEQTLAGLDIRFLRALACSCRLMTRIIFPSLRYVGWVAIRTVG
jgi:hypothetical protein